jgi:Kef-type K+ transport system membrane component KefB
MAGLRRQILIYGMILLILGSGILLILRRGARLERGHLPPILQTGESPAAAAGGSGGAALSENLRHPIAVLLLQVIVIIAASRAVGAVFRRLAQPAVIGEMVAGILLGPSFLGFLFPAAREFLFPPSSLGVLQSLSQIGVVLFMFVIGAEIDTLQIRRQAHAAVLVSHVSIIVPFFLGTALSLFLYRSLAPGGIPFAAFALFIGVAMSITAFPVLARILHERGLAGTPLGNTAIACASVDDVTAWCMLAVVVAIVKAGALSGALLTILLALLFTFAMLFIARPLVASRVADEAGTPARGRALVAGALVLAFASSWITEAIGIHALFGAFLAGVVLSDQAKLRAFLRDRLETVGTVLFLPLFFAFAGLRTQVGLLDDAGSWIACAGVLAVAIAGKLGAGALAARWTGQSWHDALSIGALMNTRGLIELVVLNIGYDLGILSPRMYAMMILMALATTCMTGPLLSLIGRRREARA